MPKKKTTKRRTPALKAEQLWKLKDGERIVRILKVSKDTVIAEYVSGVSEEKIGTKISANPKRFKKRWEKQK